jgi:hypothetical protein
VYAWQPGEPAFFIGMAFPGPKAPKTQREVSEFCIQEALQVWAAITRNEDPHLVWLKGMAPVAGMTGESALWWTEFWHAIRCGQTWEVATQAANNNAVSHARRLEILRNS